MRSTGLDEMEKMLPKLRPSYLAIALILITVVGIVAWMAAPVLAPTASKSDWLTYVGSNVGFTSAWSEYRVCNPLGSDFTTTARAANQFNWYVIEAKGKLKEWHFEILDTVPDIWYSDDIKCTERFTLNSTKYQDCTVIGKIKHTDTKQVWQVFSPDKYTFKSGQCYNVRFIGSYAPATEKNPIALDNVMEIAGYNYQDYAWWNTTFIRKALITITNPAAVQQQFRIPYDSDMSSGFDDLRFTDSTEAIELSYWIDRANTTNGTAATVWVNVPSAANIYVYYKNQSVVYDASDGQKTFEFFDDFNDNSINATKWITKGTNKVFEKNGYLAITGAGAWLSGGVATMQTFDRTSTGYLMSLRYPMQETPADDVYLNSAYGDFTGTGNLQYVCNFGDTYSGVSNTTCQSQQYRNVSSGGWTTVIDGNIIMLNSRLNLYLNKTKGYQWYVNSSLMASTAAMDANNKNNYNFTVEQYVSTTNGTIDDFYVAKIALTPPTYSIGAEESTGMSTSVTLLLNSTAGDIALTYGDIVNATATINVTGLWVGITHNGTLIANDTTRSENDTVWGAGIHQFTAFYTGNGTYTYATNVSRIATVNQAPTTIHLAINGTEGDVNHTYPAPSNITAWKAVSNGNLSLYRNGTLINSTTTENMTLDLAQYAAGIYNFTVAYNGTNYSASPVTRMLSIAQNNSALALASTAGWNIVTGSSTTITCSNSAGQAMTMTKDGTTVPNPYTAVLGNGTFVFVCTIPDSANYTPASATNTLIVSPAGAGCINALQFGYYTEVAVSAPSVELNFSTIADTGTVRYDLGDIYLNTSNATMGVDWATRTVSINSTNVSSFWLSWGNYYSQTSQSYVAHTNTTMTNFSQNEFSPYRYDLTLWDEMYNVQRIEPNTTSQSLTLFCSGGSTIINMTSNNHTQFTIAPTVQLTAVRYSLSYAPTSTYYRDLIVRNPIEARSFYLLDALSYQLSQIIFKLDDRTGNFGTGTAVELKKYIGGGLETMTELRSDVEQKAITYLRTGDRYDLYLDNGVEERSIGDVYADATGTKNIIINTVFAAPNASAGNSSINLTYSGGTFNLIWYDPSALTTGVEFWVYNYSNYSYAPQLYYANSTNHSSVNFVYPVPNTNWTYRTKYLIHSTLLGLNSPGAIQLWGPEGIMAVIPNMITMMFAYFGADVATANMWFFLFFLAPVPLLFPRRFIGIAALLFVGLIAFLWYVGMIGLATGSMALGICLFVAIMVEIQARKRWHE